MKNLKYILLLLFFIIYPTTTKAAICSDSEIVELQNIAKNISTSYDYVEENGNVHPTVALATCRAQNPRPTVGPSRPLAHRTVRCTPDSPVNFSRTPSANSRERPLRSSQPGAPDTVRCTTGQSGDPRLSRVLAARAKTFSIGFFLFPALRHNTLVHKTLY